MYCFIIFPFFCNIIECKRLNQEVTYSTSGGTDDYQKFNSKKHAAYKEIIARSIEINLKLIEIMLQLSISFSMAILPYSKDSLKVSLTL
jgi:hypothetical protein